MRNFWPVHLSMTFQEVGSHWCKKTAKEEESNVSLQQAVKDQYGLQLLSSSCDSLALSSSSPEPLREVILSQEEACRKLLELQEPVCRAVPQLMEFLSIIEDSGVILQQTVSALNMAGWPLNTLCQDPGQVQTPDQLERFVMVARTIPEDVKRLVSIIVANGKLLFRASQKDPQPHNIPGPPETKKSPTTGEQEGDFVDDDNDYVELQTKNDFEKQQKELQKEPKENVKLVSNKAQDDKKCHSSESNRGTDEQRSPSMSEHCRLYFGALQKAIGGFVDSLRDGQPPERFISQSKLVIMVGQRLVDTLCREAQRGGSGQSLLCKSNHLCALLKQLAVATKRQRFTSQISRLCTKLKSLQRNWPKEHSTFGYRLTSKSTYQTH
ncbi:hypothetical protein INR49_024879 [Caranx melampygus]|nr:hypothetical protein INR49_024879 [Caranx melampygus]